MSRRHAHIVIGETWAVLEDLASKNGTYLRGSRIEALASAHEHLERTLGADHPETRDSWRRTWRADSS